MAGLPKYRTVMLCGKFNNILPYGLNSEELQAIQEAHPVDDRDLLTKGSAIRAIYALNNLGYRVISATLLNDSDMMWMLEKPLGHSSS